MSYNIEIKKIRPIEGVTHKIDIFSHEVMVYLKHGVTKIKGALVEDPINNLNDTINNMTEGLEVIVDYNIT